MLHPIKYRLLISTIKFYPSTLEQNNLHMYGIYHLQVGVC